MVTKSKKNATDAKGMMEPIQGAQMPAGEIGHRPEKAATPTIRPDDLHRYLTRFGYLEAGIAPGESTRAALRGYQRFNGLAETGELDDATAALMSTPRCGNPDVPNVQQAVPTGTRWTTLDLRYGFTNFTDDLTRSQIRGAVRRAFARWSAVTQLTFTEVPIDQSPEIKIRFATGNHGDGSPFDGFGSITAHAFNPPHPTNTDDLPGDIHFDDDESWTVTIPGLLFGPDLQSVATHEIGHALGLEHSSRGDAIMQPYLPYALRRRALRHDDLAGIQWVYGSPVGNWRSIGGGLTSGPAACISSSPSSRLHVFARGEDNAIWHTSSDRWGDWVSIGGGLTSGPAACISGSRLHVFARGEDNAIWHTSSDRWGDWVSIGGGLTSGPAACSSGSVSRVLHVFARGEDNAMWHTWYDGRWHDWESRGGGLTSGPAACSWDSGRLDVFARGEDNAMWHIWYDGRWHDWESLGGGFTSGPTAVALAPGRMDIFARGEPEQINGLQSMAIWHNTYRNGWIGWASLGGGLTSEPGACASRPDRLDVFARGEDNAIWHTYSQGPHPAWRS